MRAFQYLPDVPEEYRCASCGAHPVKLWREYERMVSHQVLRCLDCACAQMGVRRENVVDEYGRFREGDPIDWLVPAVPTEDGSTYWGYTSVPEAGVCWWKSLPFDRKK